MDTLTPLSAWLLLLGLALGAGLGAWWAARTGRQMAAEAERQRGQAELALALAQQRAQALEAEQQRLLAQHAATQAQASQWRDALDLARDERAQLAERASRVPALEAELAALHSRHAEDQQLQLRLSNELTEANARLAGERAQADEKLALLQSAREALAEQFKNLANDILEEKSKRFAEQNQGALGQLLDPLKLRISEFQAKVEDVYVKEGKDRSALAEQVRQLLDLNQALSQDAKNLTRALTGSAKSQGNWGELVLERVLEASGLRKGEEYTVQDSRTREDGSRAQPDVVIHLPEGRQLVVDAKVSLTAYEAFANLDDEAGRQAALKRHLDSIRAHMRGLSERNYQDLYQLKSLDFVLMFVPIEPAFMLAVSSDRELFMEAWQKNVLMVSPSTLLFVVRTVAHLWRQEAQNRNAQDIARRGAELYDKLVGFVEDLESLGNRLKQAQKDYDAAHSKLSGGRGNVIRQAEMLRELGVKPSKALPATLVEAAAQLPLPPAAPEA